MGGLGLSHPILPKVKQTQKLEVKPATNEISEQELTE